MTPVIVADASLVCDALMAAGPARDQLVADAVAIPHLADAEVVSALRRLVRRGELPHGDAEARLARWASFAARRHDARPLLPRVWALRDTLTAYDAMYVALAEALGCPLVTADRRLAGAPGLACDVRVIGRGG